MIRCKSIIIPKGMLLGSAVSQVGGGGAALACVCRWWSSSIRDSQEETAPLNRAESPRIGGLPAVGACACACACAAHTVLHVCACVLNMCPDSQEASAPLTWQLLLLPAQRSSWLTVL